MESLRHFVYPSVALPCHLQVHLEGGVHQPRGLRDRQDVRQDQCAVEEVEDRMDSAHGLDKEDMVHSHHYNTYLGTVTRWGRHVLRALAEDGMEGHEGFPEGMDDDSEAEYTALMGRVHAVERTSQCCSSWGCPLGLHLAVVGKMNGHLGQGVAPEDAQVAAEDVRRGWRRHVMYQEDRESVSLDGQRPLMTVVGQYNFPVSNLEPD